MLIGLVLLALTVALAVWELWVCEGAHLGRGFVVWLYDLAAFRYDRIKDFDWDWERRFLGEPLAAAIGSLPEARVLDIGAGTGRVARALMPLGGVQGRLVCLEPSRLMLRLGRREATGEAGVWLRGWGEALPFSSATFDIVTMIEVLEFTPRPRVTLAEAVRVLRPGGWLLISNRIGREARWIIGHTFRSDELPSVLQSQGLQDIDVVPWQVEYDLAWARKA
jgi:ubiquinone/menaquinone biosynthesis C-methylase UbiE